jgi:hypothetical protein
MTWKLFLPMSMPIIVTWSVALRAMVHAPSVYCTQSLRMRSGARSVHPISGYRSGSLLTSVNVSFLHAGLEPDSSCDTYCVTIVDSRLEPSGKSR